MRALFTVVKEESQTPKNRNHNVKVHLLCRAGPSQIIYIAYFFDNARVAAQCYFHTSSYVYQPSMVQDYSMLLIRGLTLLANFDQG